MGKWTRGERITDPMTALGLIVDGNIVFWHRKPQNAGWLWGMQLGTIVGAVRKGIIYRAIEATEQQGKEGS